DADQYEIRISPNIESASGLSLGKEYRLAFTAVTDLTSLVTVEFSHARTRRADETVSYDVTVTNRSTRDLLLPLLLSLDPQQNVVAEPLENVGRTADGAWLIDLSGNLSGGLLRSGESTVGRTVTISNH